MTLPLTREEALAWLHSMPQLDSDMNHYLETEAIMKALAERFNEDEAHWAMIGLLHDVDWPFTKQDISQHCVMAGEMLRAKGFDEGFIDAVQSHGYGYPYVPAFHDRKRSSRLEHCLAAAETLTGVIYAYALMRGSICGMEAAGLKKKFKDKSFAANCNRELVKEIELAGLPLEEFFALSIAAIIGIRDTIGLA